MTADNSTVPKIAGSKIKFHKLENLSVIGNFDGDGKQDTIIQHKSKIRLTHFKMTGTQL
jgi:hypothetical protein